MHLGNTLIKKKKNQPIHDFYQSSTAVTANNENNNESFS